MFDYPFNVIAIMQVRTVRDAVKPGASFNLQRRNQAKPSVEQGSSRASPLKPDHELLSYSETLPCDGRKLIRRERKHTLILSVRVANAGKAVSPVQTS